MNNEVKKETNLEHYKEELKDIFAKGYNSPRTMASEIVKTIDGSFKCRTETKNKYTDKILEWMAQPYEEHILDDVEKQYLSNIITPFGDRVKYIYLTQLDGYVYIVICVKSIRRKTGSEAINLPLFEKGTMYKGMVIDRHYSLKELGL